MVDHHHRWSSLPDDILQNIITRLDIDQNFLFTVSSTNFDVKIHSKKPGIWSILDNLFTIFCSPLITNFSIQLHYTFYEEPCSSTILHSWVRFLRACNVKHLKLKYHPFPRSQLLFPTSLYNFTMPRKIFRGHSLVSLDLDFCLAFKGLVWFHSIKLPNLKDLKLGLVNCYRSLKRLLRFCPCLESLSLTIDHERHQKGKNNNRALIVASKNLKQLYLILRSRLTTEVMMDCPQLEKFQYESNYSMLSMWMFNTISHVKSLVLDVSFPIRLYHDPKKTVFPNLTHLTISVSECEIFHKICYMLHCCPNLEVLELNLFGVFQTPWMPEATIGAIMKHVKQVTVQCNKHMLNIVTYMLRSAPVLKKLIIISSQFFDNFNYNTSSAKARFYQTLLECPKASPSCEIEFY